jgi:chitinase
VDHRKLLALIEVTAYDYHGAWDAQSSTPVTNPHTSILDMRDSVLLYRRAGIAMEKGMILCD